VFELLREPVEAFVGFAKPFAGAGSFAKSLLAGSSGLGRLLPAGRLQKLLSASGLLLMDTSGPARLLSGTSGLVRFLPAGCFANFLTNTSSLALMIAVPFPAGTILAVATLPLAVAAVLVAVRAAFVSGRRRVDVDASMTVFIAVSAAFAIDRRRVDVDAIAAVPVRVSGMLGQPVVIAGDLSVFLSIILAAVLPPLTLRLAIEIGGPCRLAVLIVVWLDDAVEPFADRHAGSSRRFARSLTCLPTEASQIPRTARFHSRAQTTSGGATCALSRAGAR